MDCLPCPHKSNDSTWSKLRYVHLYGRICPAYSSNPCRRDQHFSALNNPMGESSFGDQILNYLLLLLFNALILSAHFLDSLLNSIPIRNRAPYLDGIVQ